jgi:hypothetical protein
LSGSEKCLCLADVSWIASLLGAVSDQ